MLDCVKEMNRRPRILAGSARSGTTWILDVLVETNHLRPIFEPLHPQVVYQAKPYAGRFLESDLEAGEFEAFLRQVFTGRYHSLWTDYRIRPRRLLLPGWNSLSSPGDAYAGYLNIRAAIDRYFRYKKYLGRSLVLVKMIRANLMLGWLREKFDAKIVFVVRHPGAVVESKLRIGGVSWDPVNMLDHYRAEGVLGEYGARYRALLVEDLNPAESHALIWCIENQLPLEQAEDQAYDYVFYENLIRNGEHEWKRIIDALGLKTSPYGLSIIEYPSQQAHSKRSKRYAGKQWYDRLGQGDLESIHNILRATGVTCYGAYDPMPLLAHSL